jgi:hypothetical protein
LEIFFTSFLPFSMHTRTQFSGHTCETKTNVSRSKAALHKGFLSLGAWIWLSEEGRQYGKDIRTAKARDHRW